MLDGKELTPEEYIRLIDEELRRLEAEKLKANFKDYNDTTEHSEQSAFLYEVDIIKTQHYEGFDFDLNGVLDGN